MQNKPNDQAKEQGKQQPAQDGALDNPRQRIEAAKGAIADALFAIDDIKLQQNPRIESDYAVKIGAYENRLLEATVACRRARRALALARVAVNRGDPIDEGAIGKTLDTEFAEWQRKIDEAMDAYTAALERRNGSVPMSPHDTKELKTLYRKLMKRLHPDLNPGLDERRSRLFSIAQSAYSSGDVQALRALWATVEGEGETDEDTNANRSDEELAAEAELLEAQAHVWEERLSQLKESFPYRLREKLSDPAWVAQHVEELKERESEQKQARQRYEQTLRELVEEERR